MHYVPTKTESHFIRSEIDLGRFALSYAKKVERVLAAHNEPQLTKLCTLETGEIVTLHIHAITGELLSVTN